MNTFKPEIQELLKAVEKKYSQNLRTTTDFDVFSLHLKLQLDVSISTSTLKRLWGYVKDKHKPRNQTLDSLAQYIGFFNFNEFCAYLKDNSLCNSSFFVTKQIQTRNLSAGEEIEIGWSPNRYLHLQYQGDSWFEVVEAQHSKLVQGDRFEAVSFLMGQPLSLGYVLRDNQKTPPFIAGRNGGLMLNNDLLSSGFVGEDIPSQESMFSNISEFYRSESGYSCLHLCRRYGKLHILKSLQPPFRQEEFYKQLLHKEFNIGYQLDHPNIRHTIDWEQQEDLGLCIVMEYVDGISLKEFMIQGKLTQPLAYKFIRELCEALHYIHSKQLVHKDLKPENIIITHNGNNVKLIDFGLSDRDDYDTLKIPAGTKKYLAPEQLLPHASPDCRTDIYSLGVIIQDITSVIKDRRLVRIAQKCTQKNPDKRFHSAQEVLEALNVRRHSKSILYISAVAVLSFLTTFYLKNLSSQPDKPGVQQFGDRTDLPKIPLTGKE